MIEIKTTNRLSIAPDAVTIILDGVIIEIENLPGEGVLRVSCLPGWSMKDYPDYQSGVLRIVKDSEEVVSSDSVPSGD